MALINGNGDNFINYIPGVKSISSKDLMSYIQAPDAVPVLMKIVGKAFEQVKNADFILCNTVQELESECLSALNLMQPTYAIGPMNFFSDFTKTVVVEKSLWAESDCTHWLSSKPPASVLYISFGSIVQINKQDIVERLLMGFSLIEGSSSLGAECCPFQPCRWRISDDNTVVGTRCGGMWSGVPMICYPFYVDQPTNRKLVVDDWKIGIDLCDGGQTMREEVASKIDILMRGKSSTDLRKRSRK
ncbi:UDP-glycosyltransferase 86A1 [Sesamum angolense]|uniref:UDP-glycosyltransferase 86A1 n=1 Tax=Sesamum angolense TaxID=2727404 RepID=A0AAE1W711_9LAMI|nr:UDP-glycosyltransferase 86A1 [Sesamum angolense]